MYPDVNNDETGTRGTDEIFFKIVRIAPAAILKLVGVTQGHQYQIQSEILKSKKVSPDIIAKPVGETGDVIFRSSRVTRINTSATV